MYLLLQAFAPSLSLSLSLSHLSLSSLCRQRKQLIFASSHLKGTLYIPLREEKEKREKERPTRATKFTE
ncbi:hypothetical protein BT93_B2675 [Corymbia citriodora subsp. variegata]|nr:hypothetical protein BT93_B2675 [Corymbia citriodora subsp. variegata]